MTEYAWPIVAGVMIVLLLCACRMIGKLLDRLMARNFEEYRAAVERPAKSELMPKEVEEESLDSGMLDLAEYSKLADASESGYQKFGKLQEGDLMEE